MLLIAPIRLVDVPDLERVLAHAQVNGRIHAQISKPVLEVDPDDAVWTIVDQLDSWALTDHQVPKALLKQSVSNVIRSLPQGFGVALVDSSEIDDG